MTYYDALYDALKAEALHREHELPDITLPPKDHERVPGSIPISFLGACPKAKIAERRDLTPKFPELDWRNNPASIFKINDGNLTEAFVQKALIRAGLCGYDDVEVSVRIDQNGVRLHGRL